MADSVKPWDRQRDNSDKLEPSRWFSRFTTYRTLGPDRSLLATYNAWRSEKGRKAATGAPLSWSRTAKCWRWRERAEAWDEHRRQEDEAKWEERREELRGKEWDTAQALIERAELMLKHPLAEATRTVEEQGPDGRPVTVVQIIKPVRWRIGDIPRFLETASKLARLAAGMETAKETARVLNMDVAELTDEQLQRIADGEDPLAVLAASSKSKTRIEEESGGWSPPTPTG